MTKPNPRLVAVQILNLYHPQRTNLSQVIDDVLRKQEELSEKGFTRDLAWGVVRRLNSLDWLIDAFVSRKDKLEPKVRTILRLGLFQLLFYDKKLPEYVIVNETVNLAALIGRRSATGLVNGVLRTALRRKNDLPWPAGPAEERISVLTAHPRWLVRRWCERWGEEETVRRCEADNASVPFTVRVNTLKTSREALQASLAAEGVGARLCDHSPDGLILEGKPELEKLPAYRDGCFLVQDEASQLVTAILAPRPGETIVDLCSGAGIKASHIAQWMQRATGGGKIIAVDNSAAQIERAKLTLKQLGISGIELLQADARAVENIQADAVLVDAPCSGLGVIRRKPDIKWNRTEKDVVEHYPPLQKELLVHAAQLVKPGGRIVYSTCTVEPNENEGVVTAFLAQCPGFTLERPAVDGTLLSEDGKWFTPKPYVHNMDGFFAAHLRKNDQEKI